MIKRLTVITNEGTFIEHLPSGAIDARLASFVKRFDVITHEVKDVVTYIEIKEVKITEKQYAKVS